MEGGVGAVDGFDKFVVCVEAALESWAVVCPEETVGMFPDLCVSKIESSEAQSFINDVVKEKTFKDV